MVDKKYCMSAYLMFRSLLTPEIKFQESSSTQIADGSFERTSVKKSEDLYRHLKNRIEEATVDGKAALMLSGGIDSAILASFMPKDSMTYTLKCIVPGVDVTDETKQAKVFADMFGLRNQVIEIYWEDLVRDAPVLMNHKGAPIHSIEVQLYKAALEAKRSGFTKLIFGENADIIYGGMNGLLAKDWTIGEFIDRYSYVLPYKVLREPQMILEPFHKYELDGFLDAHAFLNEYFRIEALGSYNNACATAGIEFIGPYSTSKMDIPIDLQRIRSGDTKYLVREVFRSIFGDLKMPPKTPLPRPMDEWMMEWNGPLREEFYPNCIANLSGDQKWMVYALERYLNILEGKDEHE